MEAAINGLDMVMESLEAAANICKDCVQEVANQSPVLQAVSSQASALKETLAAVEDIVVESTDAPAAPSAEPVASFEPDVAIASEVQMESIKRRLMRRLR